MTWIDYRKAFDLVPHEWLKMVVKAIRAPLEVRRLIRKAVPLWKTDVVVRTREGESGFPVTFHENGKERMRETLAVVEGVSGALGFELGLPKCSSSAPRHT